jgi:hypothetical protein
MVNKGRTFIQTVNFELNSSLQIVYSLTNIFLKVRLSVKKILLGFITLFHRFFYFRNFRKNFIKFYLFNKKKELQLLTNKINTDQGLVSNTRNTNFNSNPNLNLPNNNSLNSTSNNNLNNLYNNINNIHNNNNVNKK